MLSHPEDWIEPLEEQNLNLELNRRLAGEPLPYILGEWYFYGRSFKINPSVLIPRSETETLVEAGLSWLRVHPGSRKTADIGTGSGVIAISLAAEIPDLAVTSVDISPNALIVARENAVAHNVSDRIQFTQGDLLEGLNASFDLICANLPYIPTSDLNSMSVSVFEPRAALDGGSDGLQVIIRLLDQIPPLMATPGLALIEFQYDQFEKLLELTRRIIPDAVSSILSDLSNHPRVLRVEFQ